MNKPTKTTNRLHFIDLSPARFEDLCFQLLMEYKDWKELRHYGKSGSDDGVDILGVEDNFSESRIWHIQCKRWQRFHRKDVKSVIDKIIAKSNPPQKLLLIIACDASKTTYEFLESYGNKKGIKETELWTASILEGKLYKNYQNLLHTYFGINLKKRVQNNTALLKQSMRMEKRVGKELIDHEFVKKTDFTHFLYRPETKFISSKVIIRNIDDNSYPEYDDNIENGNISPWFKTCFYNTYHKGIEFWLTAGMSSPVLVDENGNWEPIENEHEINIKQKGLRMVRAMMIGRIPFSNIVEIRAEGDEYFSEPHLYCKFNFDGTPYEEICYSTFANKEQEIHSYRFENRNRFKF